MTDDELSKLALLTSPEIVRDHHAFAAMVARHCGTAGPVLHAENPIADPVSVQGTEEASH